MKQIRIRINDLLDQHAESFYTCKGCAVCTEIKQLSKQLEREPAVKFKRILDKGPDMRKSDIEFLLENQIQKKVIWKALGLTQSDFWELMDNFGLRKKRKTKEEKGMAAVSFEFYQDMKAKGLSDSAIARECGIKQATLAYHKKRWFKDTEKPVKAEKEVSETKPSPVILDTKSADYETEIKGLKIKIANQETTNGIQLRQIEKLQTDLHESGNTCADMHGEIVELRAENMSLTAKVKELQSLHAACEDVESEASSLRESMIRYEAEVKALKELLRFYL